MTMAMKQQQAETQKQELQGSPKLLLMLIREMARESSSMERSRMRLQPDIAQRSMQQFAQMAKVAFKSGDIETGVKMTELADKARDEQAKQAKAQVEAKEKEVKGRGRICRCCPRWYCLRQGCLRVRQGQRRA